MSAISKPSKDTRFMTSMDNALVIRKGEIDPLGEYAIFMWNGTGWVPLELGSVASATQAPAIA